MGMSRRWAFAAAWIAVVACCAVLVWWVIGLVGDAVLSPALGPPPTTPSTSSTTASAPPPADPTVAALDVQGGSVAVNCTTGAPVIELVTPLDGWSFETEIDDGQLEVTFRSAVVKTEVHVQCVNGQPLLTPS